MNADAGRCGQGFCSSYRHIPGLEIEAIPFLDRSPSTTVTRGWSDATTASIASGANASSTHSADPDPYVAVDETSTLSSSRRRPRMAATPSRGRRMKSATTATSRTSSRGHIRMVDRHDRTASIGLLKVVKNWTVRVWRPWTKTPERLRWAFPTSHLNSP
jgi:hypothetical protein